MAKFTGCTTQELMQQFRKLGVDTEQMFKEMVIAGATVAQDTMTSKMPVKLREALTSENIVLSKPYLTPSDGGINCQVMVTGYFINRYGKKTPAPLVANMFEYGSTSKEYPKASFLRQSFPKKKIEEAMLEVQKKYITED